MNKAKLVITDLILEKPMVKTHLITAVKRKMVADSAIAGGYKLWTDPRYVEICEKVEKAFDELVKDEVIGYLPRHPLVLLN